MHRGSCGPMRSAASAASWSSCSASSRAAASIERNSRLRIREGDLIAAHGVAWAELAGFAIRAEFSRGFVETVTIDGTVSLAGVLARAPLVRAVCCEVDERREIDRLFASPEPGRAAHRAVRRSHRPAPGDRDPPSARPSRPARRRRRRSPRRRPAPAASVRQRDRDDRLARSPIAAQLERLHIPGVRMTRPIAADPFAHLPSLRAPARLARRDHHGPRAGRFAEPAAGVVDEHELAAPAGRAAPRRSSGWRSTATRTASSTRSRRSRAWSRSTPRTSISAGAAAPRGRACRVCSPRALGFVARARDAVAERPR